MRLCRGKVLLHKERWRDQARTETWRTSSFKGQTRGRDRHGRRRENGQREEPGKAIHFRFLPECLPEPLAHEW